MRVWVWIALCSVLRPRQHSIGCMGDGFYRSKDPTNSIKVRKIYKRQSKQQKQLNTHQSINQSINFYGGLNNKQLPQGPRPRKERELTKAQYTPPTPTRLNCRVESGRRCVLNSQLSHDDCRRKFGNWTCWEFILSSWVVSALCTRPLAVVTQFIILQPMGDK